jgi:serine/threonine-protein kinase
MPSELLDHLVGKTLNNRFRVLRRLGAGGMGTVFEAADLANGSAVAIKVLHRAGNNETSMKRFRREALTAARLGRPHAVEIFDIGELDTGEPFFVMEKLAGETLRRRMMRERRLPPMMDVVSIFVQLLSVLEAVHAQGIIHRDIKPENIFLLDGKTGDVNEVTAKLIDFGVAKLMEGEDDREDHGRDSSHSLTNLTETGVVVGTVGYVSPEQISSPRDIDERADLWACGVALYETLTGHRPFHGKTVVQVMLDIVNRKPVPPRQLRPHIPADLDAIVLTALKKRPDERYPSAHAFRRALIDSSIRYRKTEPRRTMTTRPPPPPMPEPIAALHAEQTSETSLKLPVFKLPTDIADMVALIEESDTDEDPTR